MGHDQSAGRVLVVDDNDDIRSLVEFKLVQAGYTVTVAGNGPDGLDRAREWHPDLVVLDVAMPGMTGYDVCKEMRGDPATAHIPVIMLTARDSTEFSTLGYMAGADMYLTKPIVLRTLLDKVESLIHADTR
ncbi:response regulator transcription factor [Virgisporangium aliadipatigenens]|uniref:response regulator transcription factor n=1 Tax=Virgisporangium aliadipatigenens TaxID=741659 RepID=UPI001EF292D8|nr:response regulator [Virgisporangium aliadipatigenens]